MDDDAVRQACEALLELLQDEIEVEGGYFRNVDVAIRAVMAFARQQQAVGLRRAEIRLKKSANGAGASEYQQGWKRGCLVNRDWCQQEARRLEDGQ